MRVMWVFALVWLGTLGASSLAQVPNGPTNQNPEGASGAPLSGWTLWSGWGQCTRTCGGGVREQFRHCRKSDQANGDVAVDDRACQGSNKRYEQCNQNPCPKGGVVSEVDQCAKYNLREFGGKKYFWEPMDRGGPCQLYCNARGHRFFLRRSSRITDGKECISRSRRNRDSTGRNGIRRMCINGKCASVGCDGQIASGKKVDVCGVCGGKGASCSYRDGHYRLQPPGNGFHLVKRIPAGAKFINITEEGSSPSYLAVRSGNPPHPLYINSEVNHGRPDRSQQYIIAGTTFIYKRPFNSAKGESIIADGPTNEPLEVMVFFQGEHPGIRYEFIIPNLAAAPQGNPQPTVRENQRLEPSGVDLARQNPYNPGHVRPQQSLPRTYPETGPYRGPYYRPRGRVFSHTPLNRVPPYWARPAGSDDVDHPSDDPDGNTNSRRSLQIINRGQSLDGTTAWVRRGYEPCSESCAQGMKRQRIVCVLRANGRVVDDSQCLEKRPVPKIRQCNTQPCPPFYEPGSWSECSRSCGVGRRIRRVVCRQRFAGNFTSAVRYQKCARLTRPNTHEQCQIQECARWEVLGDWSKCNAKCGSGTQTRRTVCRDGDGRTVADSACGSASRPSRMRKCDSGPCVTNWFVTDWRECSADCNQGVQRRNVRCLNTAQLPSGCPARTQPAETRTCASSSCGVRYEWFAGRWGACSSKCGAGVQERRVVCLQINADDSMSPAEEVDGESPCDAALKPEAEQNCNTQSCGSRWYHTRWTECTVSCGGGTRTRDVHCLDEHGGYSDLCDASERPKGTEQCNTANCITLQDPNCTDRLHNCQLVQRARLCLYAYYRATCCLTCTLHRHAAETTITFRK